MPTVRFLPKNTGIEVPKGTRLIDAIRQAGLPIARACGDDLICAKCHVEILQGSVTREAPIETDVKARNQIEPKFRLACAIRVHDDLTLTTTYWGD